MALSAHMMTFENDTDKLKKSLLNAKHKTVEPKGWQLTL